MDNNRENIQQKNKSCYTNDMARAIDISTAVFENIRERDLVYVDKTKYIYSLINPSGFKHIFLSRPRRFGKSLTIFTLKAIFEGRKELFDNLYISKTNYDWKKYPVIRISFGSCSAKNGKELENYIDFILKYEEEKNNLFLSKENNVSQRFARLISELAKKEKVVILIDEYEKVITDNIYNKNIEELRDKLSQFYQVLKDQDENIRFTFITGVTKYTKLSIFSKMNNLKDISMSEEYSTMLGYTQNELEYYFSEHIEECIRKNNFKKEDYLKRIKDMYNGYSFYPKANTVYNPVSIGNFFSDGGKDFDNYWMETGGNSLVYELSKKIDFNMVSDLSKPIMKTVFSTFDIMDIQRNYIDSDFIKALLVQTGYLTIKASEDNGRSYLLDFPNNEVRTTFNTQYLPYVCEDRSQRRIFYYGANDIMTSVETGNCNKLIEAIKSMLSGIPKAVSTKASKENEYYYESLIYMIFSSAGIRINIEELTSSGRIDAVAESKEHIYIVEFKKDKNAEEAMKQILGNHYPDKFLATGKKIHLIAINFSTSLRNIDDFIIKDL